MVSTRSERKHTFKTKEPVGAVRLQHFPSIERRKEEMVDETYNTRLSTANELQSKNFN